MYVNGNPVMGVDPSGHDFWGMKDYLTKTSYSDITISHRNHHVLVDLDKTLARKLKYASDQGVFSLDSCIINNTYNDKNFHFKFSQNDVSRVAYNKELSKNLGVLHQKGYKIHVLSTGGWLEGAKDFFQDKIRAASDVSDFHFESFTSSRYSTRADMKTGMNWANGFLPSFLSAFNKLIFLNKISREYRSVRKQSSFYVVLLDDQWYNRIWFKFKRNAYSNPMYKKSHLKGAFASFDGLC